MPEDVRARLLADLDRYGSSPLSALLRYEAPWRAFTSDRGSVPWLAARRAAVVWSDPLCEPGDSGGLLASFAAEARADGRALCLIAVSEPVARAALEQGFSALKVGEEPWFDLASWRRPSGDRGKKLRWAVNHARRAGIEVEEYPIAAGRSPAVEAEIEGVVARWRADLRRSEADAFMRTDILGASDAKRIFLARSGGEAVAVLGCASLPAIGSWYLEDLVRVPGAVNGATELLVVDALAALRADGAAAALFALAPMRRIHEQLDRRSRMLGRVLHFAIRGFDRRYGFRAIARYEERFEPTRWSGRYVCFKPAFPRPAAVRAAMRYLG